MRSRRRCGKTNPSSLSSDALDRREAADRQATRIAEATEYGSGAALNHSAKGRDRGAA